MSSIWCMFFSCDHYMCLDFFVDKVMLTVEFDFNWHCFMTSLYVKNLNKWIFLTMENNYKCAKEYRKKITFGKLNIVFLCQ